MADDDPEIWHAIHRLATVMDSLDGDFVMTDGLFGTTDEHWTDEKSSDAAYVISNKNGKTLAEKKALLVELQNLVLKLKDEIKGWEAHYTSYKTDDANAKAKAKREEKAAELDRKHAHDEDVRKEKEAKLAKKQAEDKAKRDAAVEATNKAEQKRKEAAEAKQTEKLAKLKAKESK
jgi:translation initiation factor IF-2